MPSTSFLYTCTLTLLVGHVLQATAIFQAKEKLKSIKQAHERRISSEELIQFAHRISTSNAVQSPPTWQPGTVNIEA